MPTMQPGGYGGLPSRVPGREFRGGTYTPQQRDFLFQTGTGAWNQPDSPLWGGGYGNAGMAKPQMQRPVGGQMPGNPQVFRGGVRVPQQWANPQQFPQQPTTPGGYGSQGAQQPPLRVSQQPSTAQHLSDLLSQRNQATALELNRGASLANAQHGLNAQRARAGAGLGWAGIHSSEQLAGVQNQFDVLNAIIRMLNDPLANTLGGF